MPLPAEPSVWFCLLSGRSFCVWLRRTMPRTLPVGVAGPSELVVSCRVRLRVSEENQQTKRRKGQWSVTLRVVGPQVNGERQVAHPWPFVAMRSLAERRSRIRTRTGQDGQTDVAKHNTCNEINRSSGLSSEQKGPTGVLRRRNFSSGQNLHCLVDRSL
ncbi:hypothetical protein B0T10DRAFT_63013 [Thelonectria olida]|uniref:Uncharacterized protein n=1 Tax=Thelonectria olida TaxID=1576542 RepID=A0A9P9AP20_9HYPO|nr:hypothetical protein B0T10DRAFT_63013 [Thelonectria olida]